MPQGYSGLANRQIGSAVPSREDRVIDSSREAGATRQISSLHILDFEPQLSERSEALTRVPIRALERDLYARVKRAFDILGAATAIVAFSPLLLVIVLVLASSGESPLFRHRRVGRGGIHFDCLKFRTMVTDADRVLDDLLNSDGQIKEEWLRDHKLKDDPRITRFGRFLRRTSLDELPQLLNVLRGDMSLVGPRPVVPEELWRYGAKTTTFLSARPGITGLWQISGRNNTDYRRRVALDVCYVRSRSLALDVYILLKTFRVVFTTSGAY